MWPGLGPTRSIHYDAAVSRLFRVPLASLAPGDHVLERATAKYVVRVHRLGKGDRFIVFDPEQVLEADAEIIEATPKRVRCRIDEVRRSDAVPRFDLTLFQAIGKGDKPDRVIKDATALGARRIVFVQSSRVVVQIPDGSSRHRGRWRVIAVEAARQSGRGDIPEIEGPIALRAALEERAPTDVCVSCCIRRHR
jgi:16S rRNA (uracil1498-N3)-methyltransferase